MEITLNFQLMTLITGVILGILLSGLISVFLWYRYRRKVAEKMVIIPQPDTTMWIAPPESQTLPVRKLKYKNSALQPTEKTKLLAQLITQIEAHKVYRQPNLTLTGLAKKMNIPKNHLSQVINEKIGCNFLEFLNQYRVKEAKEKLESADFQDLSILDIGRQAGFNSKTTYYAAFKKHTNTSPGNYRKALAS